MEVVWAEKGNFIFLIAFTHTLFIPQSRSWFSDFFLWVYIALLGIAETVTNKKPMPVWSELTFWCHIHCTCEHVLPIETAIFIEHTRHGFLNLDFHTQHHQINRIDSCLIMLQYILSFVWPCHWQVSPGFSGLQTSFPTWHKRLELLVQWLCKWNQVKQAQMHGEGFVGASFKEGNWSFSWRETALMGGPGCSPNQGRCKLLLICWCSLGPANFQRTGTDPKRCLSLCETQSTGQPWPTSTPWKEPFEEMMLGKLDLPL